MFQGKTKGVGRNFPWRNLVEAEKFIGKPRDSWERLKEKTMKTRIGSVRHVLSIGFAACLVFSFSQHLAAQEEGTVHQAPNGGEERRMPLFGKITAVHADSFEIANPDGQTVTVKFTSSTEFRKDRQAVKRSDFRVGDVVIVRGEENPDHTWTAQIVGGRSMNGAEGRGERMFVQAGTLGKDYVVGEVKSVDPPKITVLRTDKVTQTIELNEETSLRKGRESVTMADVQVGDHLLAHGALQSDVFVPKVVMVIGPEQWKRMQEMGGVQIGPAGPGKPEKPPERRN